MKSLVVLIVLVIAAPAFAQDATPQVHVKAMTTLSLGELQRAAEASDPRAREIRLLEQQGELRDRNIAVQRLPALGIESQAQYQTDAPSSPVTNASGSPLFQAPKKTYDTLLRVEQRLFDPTVSRQAALQRAQLAEDQARVRTALYTLRQQVSDAFFAVALLDQRLGVLAAAVAALTARASEMDARVREGTAVRADFAAIEASRIQRQQEEDELRTDRRAALGRLATIVGRPIDPGATPVLPDLASEVSRIRTAELSTGRPEFAQFARARERLERQREAALVQTQPKLSAFGRLGYGRPGLNFIRDEFDAYGVGGIRLQWNAWSWGTPTRESEIARLQADIVTAEEEAFARTLEQSTGTDEATIERLERTVESDARIIALREEVERAARARMQEGVLTAADYVARQSELLQSRFVRVSHEVELAQARARLLVTLGVEVP
jgi:outer membrane protein TolC